MNVYFFIALRRKIIFTFFFSSSETRNEKLRLSCEKIKDTKKIKSKNIKNEGFVIHRASFDLLK